MPGHQSACLLPPARPLTTQQKISGRLASDDTTQDRPDIRRYIDTARKHGKNAMDILHELMPAGPGDRQNRHSPRNHGPEPAPPITLEGRLSSG